MIRTYGALSDAELDEIISSPDFPNTPWMLRARRKYEETVQRLSKLMDASIAEDIKRTKGDV